MVSYPDLLPVFYFTVFQQYLAHFCTYKSINFKKQA